MAPAASAIVLALLAAAPAGARTLTSLNPVVVVLAVLGAAVLCFAFGTFRGSWRVWLVGYALTVVALALAFRGVRVAHRATLDAEARAALAADSAAAAPLAPGFRAGAGHGTSRAPEPRR